MQFLSMKLAAVNPRLDFNIEDFFAKEVMENIYYYHEIKIPAILRLESLDNKYEHVGYIKNSLTFAIRIVIRYIFIC